MKPQIVNAKMNKLLFRSKIIKASVFAAIVFSVVMMTGYRKFETSVFITDNGITKEVKTNESDVYEILRDENYTLSAEDRISYTKDDNNEGHITIHRAFGVSVKADGETHSVTVIDGTVSDILKKANVTLGSTDKVTPALDTKVNADTKIIVTRVRYAQRSTETEIPFETEYVDDPNVPSGKEEVLTEGENGVRTSKYKDTYVDDKLEKSELISEKVTKEPVNKVIKRGTAIFNPHKGISNPYNQNLPDHVKLVNGIPENYTRIISGKSTAYWAPDGSGTASGRKAVVGTVAVNPNVIPYGSELYIASPDGTIYGYAIAADTGMGMMNGTVAVDVFMASYDDACHWGVHYVDIYVLSEGNG